MLDRLDQVSAFKLGGTDVHRYLDVIWPGARLFAGTLQHPVTQRHNERNLLGDRHELGRRHQAADRMGPAQQRLKSADASIFKIVERLVVQLEFAVGQGRPQIQLQRAARLQPGIHAGLEESPDATALRLGAIKRDIRVLEQLGTGRAVIGCKRDADARSDVDIMPVYTIGCAEHVDDAPREHRRILGSLEWRLHDGELVTSQPCDCINLPYARFEARGDGSEQIVANGMPQRIVDRFEAVEIEHQHREAGLIAPGLSQRLIDALAEQDAIRQPGQRIVLRHKHDLRFGAPAFADVFVGRDPPAIGHDPARHGDDLAVADLMELRLERVRLIRFLVDRSD